MKGHALSAPLLVSHDDAASSARPSAVVILVLCLAAIASVTLTAVMLHGPHYQPSLIGDAPPTSARPVIGVVTNPTDESFREAFNLTGTSYIGGSFVEWLDKGGSRVIPLPYDAPENTLRQLLRRVNGVMFQGGHSIVNSSHPNEYMRTAQLIYDEAVQMNARRPNSFVIWGTCQGFEVLAVLEGGWQILTRTDAESLVLPLPLTHGTERYSRLFGEAPEEVVMALRDQNSTTNFHEWGVSPTDFIQTGLAHSFRALAVNTDRIGRPFISAMEARQPHLPIYATQFHPEVLPWNVDHTQAPNNQTKRALRWLSDFIRDEAARSPHRFDSAGQLSRFDLRNFPKKAVKYFDWLYEINVHKFPLNL
ncbi:unnamed protein product [Vitrella brassicaformis CCMP3155]|uniref:folate gamma-glutamyl hydrolase n=1 Tax=Vitrella brassicaformis (strain CCMP3155) TaxID=1169540 RepID=A0A0G4EHP8_VITBC|nr:unnamed protein product [Vitrella brassicaformis CCMP3155]|eukprot:CEL96035.1 unnamed protein product [Vitrella brassicaformis CCMP3155]